MDGKAYSQCLDHYLEDLKRLDNLAGRMLIFQQDGAPAHTTGYCLEKIKKNRTVFKQRWKHLAPLPEHKNYFDKGIFPSNSPDLTPVEMVWAIIEYELSKKEYKTLEDKKLELIRLWNSFPLTLCQSIMNKFDESDAHIYDPAYKTCLTKHIGFFIDFIISYIGGIGLFISIL